MQQKEQQKEQQLVQRRTIYCPEDNRDIGSWLQMVIDQDPTITLLYISAHRSWAFKSNGEGELMYGGEKYPHPKPHDVMWVAIKSEVRRI